MKKGPHFQRKESTKQHWLDVHGYKKVPPGKELDHKVPLSKGGPDTLRNLHLIKKSSHQVKTGREARRR